MGTPYSAREVKVKVKGLAGNLITLMASRVTIHTNSDRIDVSNFESGEDTALGLFYGDYITGVTSATVTIEAYDDVNDTDDVFDAEFVSGVNEGAIQIFMSDAELNINSWIFPTVTVIDVSSDAEVHGAVKTMITCMNRGRFWYPGQANLRPANIA